MLAKGYVGGMVTLGAGALALAVFIMLATTPLGLGPYGVTLWFVVVAVGVSSLLSVLAYWISARLQPDLASRKRIAHSWRRGLLAGGLVTVVLALSSLKQLNLRDIILVALLLALVEFYMVARA